MTDIARHLDAFLDRTGWGGADHAPLAGDLSARSFTRLALDGRSAILMCVPETLSGTLPAYLSMTRHLAASISVPDIFAADTDLGVALIEDFGDAKVSTLVANDDPQLPEIFDEITHVLNATRRLSCDGLHCPGAGELVQAATLISDWYPGINTDAFNAFWPVLETKLQACLSHSPALSLRDFHTDNLMWLAQRTGHWRVGVLDFQDAFVTHPAYDLMSIMTDARVDIPEAALASLRDHGANALGVSQDELMADIAVLSAQRNLRILGIFARSAIRDGKPHHLNKLPRVTRHLTEALSHPVFGSAGRGLLAAIPENAFPKGVPA